jgi:putative Mg2+ transporter-C (MgtC) family protein
MPLHPGWSDLALRLFLTLVAGALIGVNREEGGHVAGLRTNILVCLAASIAMIQANLLTDSTGKAHDSFVVYDLMRFPLGILSGMGFIGAGAILRRGDLIKGVTTAATLWFVTVVGLCFGGGQIYIGIAGTLLGTAVLWLLEGVDRNMPRAQHARLSIICRAGFPLENAIANEPGLAQLERKLLTQHRTSETTEASYDLRWRGPSDVSPPLDFVRNLLERDGISSVEWRAGDAPSGKSEGTDATKLRPNWLKT